MSYSAYSRAMAAARYRAQLADGEGHYEDCEWYGRPEPPWRPSRQETPTWMPPLCTCEQRSMEAYWDAKIDEEMER